jgi:hypothetical protein
MVMTEYLYVNPWVTDMITYTTPELLNETNSDAWKSVICESWSLYDVEGG